MELIVCFQSTVFNHMFLTVPKHPCIATIDVFLKNIIGFGLIIFYFGLFILPSKLRLASGFEAKLD